MAYRKDNEIISEECFEEVFRQWHDRLFYLSVSIVKDEETAKDIISDVLVKTWTNHRDIPVSNLGSYLMTTVKYRSYDFYTQNKTSPFDDLSILEDIPDEEYWKGRERRIHAIEDIIATMSEKTQTIMRMHYIEGLIFKDIAQAMDLNIETVKKQAQRAIERIKSEISKIDLT